MAQYLYFEHKAQYTRIWVVCELIFCDNLQF